MQTQFSTAHEAAPTFSVEFLDVAAALGEVQAGKTLSFEMLMMKSGARVLDIGCGAGTDAIALAKQVSPGGGYVTAVDFDQHLVDVAVARSQGLDLPLRFLRADIHDLPFDIAEFDAVRIDRVLHFLPDPAGALAEAVRVTANGGRVVVTEPDWSTFDIQCSAADLTTAVLKAALPKDGPAWIGAKLDELFAGCELQLLAQHQVEVKVKNMRVAMLLFGLENLARRAVLTKAIEPRDAVHWLRSLQIAEARGEFAATLRGAIACGLKTE